MRTKTTAKKLIFEPANSLVGGGGERTLNDSTKENVDDNDDIEVVVECRTDKQGNQFLLDGTLVVEPTPVDTSEDCVQNEISYSDFVNSISEQVKNKTFSSLENSFSILPDIKHTSTVLAAKCTACTKKFNPYLGTNLNVHPTLGVIICSDCMKNQTGGYFVVDKKDDKETLCRWCVEGGLLICCDLCPKSYCKNCIRRNLGKCFLNSILKQDESTVWKCFACDNESIEKLREDCSELVNLVTKYKKDKRVTTKVSTNTSKKTVNGIKSVNNSDNSRSSSPSNAQHKSSRKRSAPLLSTTAPFSYIETAATTTNTTTNVKNTITNGTNTITNGTNTITNVTNTIINGINNFVSEAQLNNCNNTFSSLSTSVSDNMSLPAQSVSQNALCNNGIISNSNALLTIPIAFVSTPNRNCTSNVIGNTPTLPIATPTICQKQILNMSTNFQTTNPILSNSLTSNQISDGMMSTNHNLSFSPSTQKPPQLQLNHKVTENKKNYETVNNINRVVGYGSIWYAQNRPVPGILEEIDSVNSRNLAAALSATRKCIGAFYSDIRNLELEVERATSSHDIELVVNMFKAVYRHHLLNRFGCLQSRVNEEIPVRSNSNISKSNNCNNITISNVTSAAKLGSCSSPEVGRDSTLPNSKVENCEHKNKESSVKFVDAIDLTEDGVGDEANDTNYTADCNGHDTNIVSSITTSTNTTTNTNTTKKKVCHHKSIKKKINFDNDMVVDLINDDDDEENEAIPAKVNKYSLDSSLLSFQDRNFSLFNNITAVNNGNCSSGI